MTFPYESMMSEVFSRAREGVEAQATSDDIGRWAYERLGVDLWSVQREVLEAVQEHGRTAVWSCHDTGKTFAAAVVVCHHIDSHPPRSARAVTTAPSHGQVRGALWGDINTLFLRAQDRGTPLRGRVNQTEWLIGSYLAAIGRKPSDYRSDQFAGYHARYPLVVLDEADGLTADMWEGIEALMTSRRAKLFAIGNPLDSGSHFAQVRKRWEAGSTAYHGIVIPYTRTPAFTGEEVSELLQDSLLSREWVELRRQEWGNPELALADPEYQPLESPYWWGRVMAEYPPEDALTIITSGMVERSSDPDEPPVGSLRQLGVDVAGSEAGDWTVCRERVGNSPLRRWAFRSSDDDAVEDFIVDCAQQARAQVLCFDATGIGFGFRGRLRRRLPGCSVNAVQFGAAADVKQEDGKTKKFKNMRSQLWWEVGRESLRRGEWNLAHMEHREETIVELTAARLVAAATSRDADKELIQVEPKDDIRRRIGRSPDDADALLLAFHQPAGGGVARVASPRGRTIATGRRSALPARTGDRTRQAVGR